jgi:hypothetical protein
MKRLKGLKDNCAICNIKLVKQDSDYWCFDCQDTTQLAIPTECLGLDGEDVWEKNVTTYTHYSKEEGALL